MIRCGTDECTNIRAGRLALVHGLSVVAAAVAAVGDEAGVVVSHDLLADCRACSSAEVCLLVLTGDDDDDRYSPITESCITHTHRHTSSKRTSICIALCREPYL